MIEDFNRKNEKSAGLEDRSPGNNSITGDSGLHIQIRRLSPFDTGRTAVSRVGFNRDKTKAIVYVKHAATPDSGVGITFSLIMQAGNG
ncbi:MAG: hypothetical protein M0033_03965 [Nitrospiraceae bacterium]|nr:hypothetical protein [Nitrospiraceae bacterium]